MGAVVGQLEVNLGHSLLTACTLPFAELNKLDKTQVSDSDTISHILAFHRCLQVNLFTEPETCNYFELECFWREVHFTW